MPGLSRLRTGFAGSIAILCLLMIAAFQSHSAAVEVRGCEFRIEFNGLFCINLRLVETAQLEKHGAAIAECHAIFAVQLDRPVRVL